jgi:hypothetical protein
VALQQMLLAPDRAHDVECGDTTSAGAAELRTALVHDGGAVAALGDAGGDEAHDASVNVFAADHD